MCSTADHADIRGLATTCIAPVGVSVLGLCSRILLGLLTNTRVTPMAGAAPLSPIPCSAPSSSTGHSGLIGFYHRDYLGDRPEEGDQLAGNRSNDGTVVLALGRDSAKPLAQPQLGFPSYVAYLLGQLFLAYLDLSGDPSRIPIASTPLPPVHASRARCRSSRSPRGGDSHRWSAPGDAGPHTRPVGAVAQSG